MNFSNIFRDQQHWRLYRPEVARPHRIYVGHNDNGKVAVVVSLRVRSEGDWSIGKAALDYVVDAERDKRIAEGYILLADNRWNVIASARACEVHTRIGNLPPNPGQWGDFWWLDSTLKPTAGYRGAGSDEVPF